MKLLGSISLEQKEVYDAYLRRYPSELSEQNFTNLFMWREARPVKALIVEETLIVYEECEKEIVLFGPPIGPLPANAAVEAIKKASEKRAALADRISEDTAAQLREHEWIVREDPSYHDYVYRREDLASLQGSRYHKKRNLIKQCLSEHDVRYEPIDASMIPSVLAMMERWCAQRDCQKERGLRHEYQATKEVLTHYDELKLLGAVIRINGEIQAFTVGEALNETTAVIHLEKAMPQFRGLYQLINRDFSRHALEAFTFINREQDLGIEGLRQAKRSYYPDHLVKKCIAAPQGSDIDWMHHLRREKRCLDEED